MLTLLALGAPQSADAVLDRYANYMKRFSSLTVDVRSRFTGVASEGKGKLIMVRPNRMAFSVKWLQTNYGLYQNEQRVTEFEGFQKKYRDYYTFPHWITPPGEVNMVGQYSFPSVFAHGDFRNHVPQGAKFTLLKSTPGARAQTIESKYNLPGTDEHIIAKIDEVGRLLSYKKTQKSIEGTYVTEIYLSNYAVDKKYPESTFWPPLKAGYRSEALPLEPWPIGIGRYLPSIGWMNFATKKHLNLTATLGPKYTLVAVVGSDCAPSRKLESFLISKSATFKQNGISFSRIFRETSPKVQANGMTTLYDPSGQIVKSMGLPGTPLIYLVDAKAVVKKVWMGFDANGKARLASEILAAAKAP